MTNDIDKAIQIHGAKAVYKAAYKRIEGNKKQLQQIGLEVNNMGDAWKIMNRAFDSLSAEEKAADYWDAKK